MPPCLVYPAAIVRRRVPAQERTYFATLIQRWREVAVVPSQVPDPPRQGDLPSRRGKFNLAFYFAPQSAAGALDFVKVTDDGKIHVEGTNLLAETPQGFENPQWQGGDTGRGNFIRRPPQPFGNRAGVNTLI